MRLSDQHPIEWIVVMQGKGSRCMRVPGRNPEFGKMVRRDLIIQMFCTWINFSQASERGLKPATTWRSERHSEIDEKCGLERRKPEDVSVLHGFTFARFRDRACPFAGR